MVVSLLNSEDPQGAEEEDGTKMLFREKELIFTKTTAEQYEEKII